jgi:apolipoprotein N-acyltransferase
VARVADGLRRLTGWRRYGAAILAGAVASLSLPPADTLPALWVALPALIWLMEAAPGGKASFWLGWSFGFGYLALSLYWLTFSLFVAIDRYWWLVPFASNGLAAGLAIYWGLAMRLAWLVPREQPVARTLAIVAMLSLTEWMRGHLLTGFPWNLPGYAWTEFPWLIQGAAWIGIYGVTVLALLAPALAAPLGSRYAGRRPAGVAACIGLALIAAAAMLGCVRLPAAAVPDAPGVRLRLVQPSIAQSLKWVPGRYADNLRQHIALSLKPPASPGDRPPTAIIWSEAAEPFPLDDHPDNARTIASFLQPGQILITGVARDFLNQNPPTFRDSIEVLNPAGEIVATDDKFHYVPFGEYMPLGRYLPLVKAVAAGDIEPTAGPGPRTIDLPGLPPAGALICYEVIFPNAVVDPARRPQWLLDVTNDAWFGRSAGPYQHFAMMRVRAVEEGLPLVNAANSGISGVIDPYGRVIARLGLGETGFIDADLPTPISATLYARLGDWPFFVAILAMALPGVIAAVAKRRRGPISQPRSL